MSCHLCKTIVAVSYMSYGPFTSYAPTYDSSFANISKDDSDLICSFYGEESSLQGSDKYVQRDQERTQALWHLHRSSLEAFLGDYLPHVSLFHWVYPVWKMSAVWWRQNLILTLTCRLLHFAFLFFLLCIIMSWYSGPMCCVGGKWHVNSNS